MTNNTYSELPNVAENSNYYTKDGHEQKDLMINWIKLLDFR